MSNYDIFNSEQISRLIKPFADGMELHITPIKYEAITPDIFAFLFRTTGKDSSQHFFVSLEFDYLEGAQAVKDIIEKWHGGSVIEFWNPEINSDGNDDIRATIDSIYYAVLAEVERPKGTGYWASNFVINDPSDINNALDGLSDNKKENIKKSLNKILKDFPGVSISVYINENDTVEYFYQ